LIGDAIAPARGQHDLPLCRNQRAHQLVVTWWHRIVPMRSYVKGWKISPSHYLNQDLANIWLDK
jgi:hypothetical protein